MACYTRLALSAPHRYLVKELFGPTLQGEGLHAGRACVFLRFANCNLSCTWCDTDFRSEGAERLLASEIVSRLLDLDRHASRFVVLPGGEPTLQWDTDLAQALAAAGFRVHMETNGTGSLHAPVDWLTVSPKPQFHRGRTQLVDGLPISECKVVVDDNIDDGALAGYEARWPSCQNWFVQPCSDARFDYHLRRAIALATARPRWRLSVQIHKIIGVP